MKDIGHSVELGEIRTVEGVTSGVNYAHLSPDGKRHESFIHFNLFGEKTGWDVLSMKPLTLSPSLRCRRCDHHGFIREGRWVPA